MTDSLGKRSALADDNLVTFLDTERRGDVCGQVLVSLLVTGVFGDKVEVLAADDQRAVHLGGNDGAGQDTATDRDEPGEGALLVCVIVSLWSCVLKPPSSIGTCQSLDCDSDREDVPM